MSQHCTCENRIRSLEKTVRELQQKLANLKESFTGVGDMMSQLGRTESCLESSLKEMMPRVDTLLTGLGAPSGSLITPSACSIITGATASSPACACIAAGAPSFTIDVEVSSSSKVLSPTCSTQTETTVKATSPIRSKKAGTNSDRTRAGDSGGCIDIAASLRQAASSGDLKTLLYWVTRSTDINAPHPVTRDTALHLAARAGNVACIQLLLLKGAVNSLNMWKEIPVTAAAAAGNRDAVKALLSQDEVVRVLQVKAALCDASSPEIVYDLAKIATGVVHSKEGGMALTMAAANGRLEVMQALLKLGADHSRVDKYGMSALHHVAAKGHVDCLRVLLDKRVNLNARDRCGRVALHHAALHGHLRCLVALMAQEPDHSIKDNKGNTPLHIASREGRVDCVKFLVTIGSDIHSQDNNGHTPLALAVAHKHRDVEMLLVNAGAKPATSRCVYSQA